MHVYQFCPMTLHVSVCPPSVHAPSHKLLSAPTSSPLMLGMSNSKLHNTSRISFNPLTANLETGQIAFNLHCDFAINWWSLWANRINRNQLLQTSHEENTSGPTRPSCTNKARIRIRGTFNQGTICTSYSIRIMWYAISILLSASFGVCLDHIVHFLCHLI